VYFSQTGLSIGNFSATYWSFFESISGHTDGNRKF
jgi:hypothetical protein